MLGHALAMARDPLRFLEQTFRSMGDVVELPMPRLPVLLLDDPSGVDHVLRSAHRTYSKRTAQFDSLALVTGNGLLTVDEGEGGWLASRRVQQPAYRSDRLDQVVTATREVVASVTGSWPKQGVVDIEQAMSEVSLEVVSRTLLGSAVGETRPLVAAVATALDRVIARARNPLAPALGVPTPGNVRLRAAVRDLDDAVSRLVEGRRERGTGGDLVGLLLESELSPRQVRDELVTTLVAGHETVASALTWTWWLLSRNPQAAERLAAEAGAAGSLEVVADLSALPWARAVFEESLRLYPPAWVISRRACEDDTVAGVDVRAGTLVVMSPWTLHRRPSAWRDARAFRPERFASGEVVPREAYLPFGAGPRLCIGREFALTEAVVVLASIARQWNLGAGPIDLRPKASVTLHPRGGLGLPVQRR
jgi:cytochrome P450